MEHVDIIRKWLNTLQPKPMPNKSVTLPIETLLDLIDNLSNNLNMNLNEKQKQNNNKKNHKIIESGEKTIIQIYQNNFLDFFYKKQINSSWTYIRYREYQIKWKAVIYLYQPHTKSYQVNKKPRNKANVNANQTITNKKTINTDIKQFFDSLSDSE